MPIPVTCDLCGATSPMPDPYAGGMAPCDRCGLFLAVPIPGTTEDFPWPPAPPDAGRDAGTAWELPAVVDAGQPE